MITNRTTIGTPGAAGLLAAITKTMTSNATHTIAVNRMNHQYPDREARPR